MRRLDSACLHHHLPGHDIAVMARRWRGHARSRTIHGMSDKPSLQFRHVIAALVTNEPGVLAQVAGMFAARGFNIDSLVVGRTENPDLSRMTIVVNGDDAVLEQVRKQLNKLVPVVKVVDYKSTAIVERDLMLITVSTTGQAASGDSADVANASQVRSKVVELANLFRAKIVDVASDRLTVEMSGAEDKLEAFVRLVHPYGIIELARTGVIAMPRGNPDAVAHVRLARTVTSAGGSAVDEGDLPPG